MAGAILALDPLVRGCGRRPRLLGWTPLLLAWLTLLWGAAAAQAAISPVASQSGRIFVSADGGPGQANRVVEVEKPAGATVRVAYLMIASTPATGFVADGIFMLAGSAVSWDQNFLNNNQYANQFAVVTSIVKPIVDAAPAGRVVFDYVTTNGTDAVGLVVVFDDPNQTEIRTAILLFGGQELAGDTFVIDLAQPIDTSTIGQILFGLGISFSFQPGGQVSNVDVNGERLTSSAGGQDDGGNSNGQLSTVGGLDDDPANPPDPFATATSIRTDDELYDLLPFVSDGDTSIEVFTTNPSNNDNIYFAYLVLGAGAIIGEGILLTPESASLQVGQQHTVQARVQDANGDAIAGREVTFLVESGPNAGQTDLIQTDSDGIASFVYTGNGGAGEDTIVASFVGSNQQTIESNRVLATWIGEGGGDEETIALAPTSAELVVGSTHTVDATVQVNGDPLSGVEVSFEVTSGPNAGTNGTATTDSNGIVSFAYIGTGGAGQDTIAASFVGSNESEIQATPVTADWIVVEQAVLGPEAQGHAVGGNASVTVRLEEEDGTPLASRDVTVEVVSGPNSGASADLSTDAAGEATFDYTGSGGFGEDLVVASFESANQGNLESNQVSVAWSVTQSLADWGQGLDLQTDPPQRRIAYVAAQRQGVRFLDVTNPDAITLLASYAPNACAAEGTQVFFFAHDVVYVPEQRVLHVALGPCGVQVVDVSAFADPAFVPPANFQPPLVASYQTPVWAEGLAVYVGGQGGGEPCSPSSNGISAVADFDSVQIFDVSDPTDPVFCSSLGISEPGIGDPVVKVAIAEDSGQHYALLATGEGASAVDITDPSNPFVAASYVTDDLGDLADSQDIAFDEARGLVYLPSWAGGLQVLDEVLDEVSRSQLLSPLVETTPQAAGTAFFTAVPCAEWICASEGPAGLQVVGFDDEAPGGLSRLTSIPVGGAGDWSWDVQVDACTAYVTFGNPSSGDGGLSVAPVPQCGEPAAIPAEEPIVGDANGDGAVGTPDFLIWRTEFQGSCSGSCAADFDGDGVVGTADFFLWRNAFRAANP